MKRTVGSFGRQLHRLLRVGKGGVVIALHRPGVAAIAPSVRVLRLKLDRPAVVGDGVVPVAHLRRTPCRGWRRRRGPSARADGDVQVVQGVLQVALQGADVAPIAVGLGVVGVQADGVGIVGHGLVVVAFLKVGEAAIEIRAAAAGGKFDRRGQVGHGLVQFALDRQRQSAVAIGRGVFRIELDRPAQQSDGRVGFALVEGLGPLAVRLGGGRGIGGLLFGRLCRFLGRLLPLGLLRLDRVQRRPPPSRGRGPWAGAVEAQQQRDGNDCRRR